MKFLNLLIILLLVFSCAENKKIKQFETALGEKNSETLTYLVENFENDFLKMHYSEFKTKKTYKQFLIDLRDGNQIDWKKFSKVSRSVFNKSELKLALYCINDSVWVEKNPNNISIPVPENCFVIQAREKCLIYDGSIEYNIGRSELVLKTSTKTDSLVELVKNTVEPNSFGSYFRALSLIPNKSEFLKNYIKDKQSVGFMDRAMVSRRFLFNKVNFNDYFIKRLIITEIVY